MEDGTAIRNKTHHSSFNESLSTLWGLIEYQKATGDKETAKAINRVSEFFLSHRLFRSYTAGKVIKSTLLQLHFPLYWHYDILQALLMMTYAGKVRILEPWKLWI